MELKFEGCINYQDVMDGSNRTFMELKYRQEMVMEIR